MKHLESTLIAELRELHQLHTIVLYGSHARGDATPESDIDVAGFADVAVTARDARVWHGVYLDGFVYPTARGLAPDAEMMGIRGGRVLLDERGLAATLFAGLDAIEHAGPAAPGPGEQQMRRVWAHKMLARIRRGDVEAHYRYHWLLYQLLEDYFALRRAWYRGPKVALAELQRDEPATFAAFARALAPGAAITDVDALAALVEIVGAA